ncbi:hypothetical protein [Microbacterium album]|uniref:Uncharacterized protein n=1 Tax=Microbacterium album TaxID=2053191 RepID=A0A917MLF6_9MICO|nr:hypothetical protein [Microbacterium album]GGH42199.1 hypothetical protein GCM10010921_15260 [Microbacterium album]
MAVRTDGGWQLSPLQTLYRALARGVDGYADAAQDGDLAELWRTP